MTGEPARINRRIHQQHVVDGRVRAARAADARRLLSYQRQRISDRKDALEWCREINRFEAGPASRLRKSSRYYFYSYLGTKHGD